jgi:ATP-dependent DNA helicase DinG
MEIFFKDLKKDCAYWGERALTKRGPVITLKAVPVDVSQMLREQVFKADRSVILTSATLAVGGSFKAQKERVGLGESLELLLDSPFDYAARSAIFAPCGLPDPKENPLAHEQAVLENCRALSEIVPGGIFFLFTSWSALKRAHQFIVENVKNRPIFKQGDEPAYSLTEKFKKAGNGLLLGTDTFWQGVDVPGRALSCVVITRLPFTSPADPLEEARIEWIAAQGKNVFNDYSVPRAVIKFRQGFGRLIRTHQDLGAVVILDPRVQTKSYGQIFLKSLPACKTVKTLEDLASFFRTAQPICARI